MRAATHVLWTVILQCWYAGCPPRFMNSNWAVLVCGLPPMFYIHNNCAVLVCGLPPTTGSGAGSCYYCWSCAPQPLWSLYLTWTASIQVQSSTHERGGDTLGWVHSSTHERRGDTLGWVHSSIHERGGDGAELKVLPMREGVMGLSPLFPKKKFKKYQFVSASAGWLYCALGGSCVFLLVQVN